MTNSPAISVIIPMYNAEKFIGECLESILAQTFQDFEVIVVDDCSTDLSFAVAESYAPKFNGRLTLSSTKKNLGAAGVPRNKGLFLSRGEYIFCMDADDLIIATALKELYTLAKKFDSEVVYFEKYYELNSLTKVIRVNSSQKGKFVDQPTFETEDIAERIEKFFRRNIWVTPWCKFVRRDLLIEHELFFPPTIIGEDEIWTCGLLFHVKKFLRVPNIVYVWRQHNDSMCRQKRSPRQYLELLINNVVFGLKELDRFMTDLDFFGQNPQYRYAVLERSVHDKLDCLIGYIHTLSAFDICEMVFKKFGKDFGDQEILMPVLFAIVCDFKKKIDIQSAQLVEQNNQLKNLSEQFQEAIDSLQTQVKLR